MSDLKDVLVKVAKALLEIAKEIDVPKKANFKLEEDDIKSNMTITPDYEIIRETEKAYTPAKNRCKFCDELVSWQKKIDDKFPVHIDINGHIIGDGRCPKFA